MRSPPPNLGLCAALLAAAALLAVGGGAAAEAEEAYVTLLYGDEFVLGVRVLGKSIRDAGTSRDLVVLVSDGVSEYSRKLLEADGFIVKHITLLANPNQVRPTRFWGVYTKLKKINMTSYKKVYLDADTIVVKSIEDIFKCGKFCANLKHSERMNSGVMVVEPSETLFKDMMDKVDSLPSYTGGDQGFLNSYYADFANSHFYEPNNPSTPEPETQRLSTLYNADVGLYMLANKKTSQYRREPRTRKSSTPIFPAFPKILVRPGAIPSGTRDMQVLKQPQEEKAPTTRTRVRWTPCLTLGTNRWPVLLGRREKRRSSLLRLCNICIKNHSPAWLLLE